MARQGMNLKYEVQIINEPFLVVSILGTSMGRGPVPSPVLRSFQLSLGCFFNSSKVQFLWFFILGNVGGSVRGNVRASNDMHRKSRVKLRLIGLCFSWLS